jgi:hypothetical protein
LKVETPPDSGGVFLFWKFEFARVFLALCGYYYDGAAAEVESLAALDSVEGLDSVAVDAVEELSDEAFASVLEEVSTLLLLLA